MKKLLLDTQTLVWAINSSYHLSKKILNLILNKETEVYFSTVSLWEVLIKHSIVGANMELTAQNLYDEAIASGYLQLTVNESHVFAVDGLRLKDGAIHKDPFDRILLAQAKEERMTFITSDSFAKLYDEDCILRYRKVGENRKDL